MDISINNNLKAHYGYLFQKELLEEIEQTATIKKVSEGQIIIDLGEKITFIPLIIDGAIKVLRENEQEQELLLYFIEPGDTCAMTTTCCIGDVKSEIRAIAETDATLLLIPITQMNIWMSKYKDWQAFILQSYHERLMELLDTIDSIAFLKMDDRLIKFLRDKAKINHNDTVKTTHQELANDLNTSRVVVSRLLKKLENTGVIKMQRNEIKVVQL
jgi:CRP/FNR family transcriptional regulator